MIEKMKVDPAPTRWRMWSGGLLAPLILVRGLLVLCVASLALVMVPAASAASNASGTDQGSWSWLEAEYQIEDDGASAAAGSVGVVFDDDPAYGASSLSEALLIAGLAAPVAADGGAGIAADPAANAWSLAEAEHIIVNRGQQGMSGRVYWVPSSFCSVC